MFFESSINYNKNKLCIYGFRENKEIQYMNMRSIVLEISAFKFFGRGCSKNVCSKNLLFGANIFGRSLCHQNLVLYKCRYKS
ncbi:hypothetical protein CNEO4_190035 [Clostridium neonatale]|nr:hypothetical protein CNEO4_200019 [Clostridium neonatale]CAI3650907.1 hypothetical protein CNEO4_190035 [Clostridium neonatale]